jgi:subtilisin family serine protease
MRARAAGAAAALASLIAAAPAAATPYVVVLQPSASGTDAVIDGLASRTGVTPRQRWSSALRGFSADFDDAGRKRLLADPAVAFVALDTDVRAAGASVPVAPGDLVPPGIRRIGAATTALVSGAAGSAVAVLDTGADLVNPDLVVAGGTNCVKPGTPPADDNGHGTHVAGVVAARNDGRGVVGVAPGTRIYAVKVLNNKAAGTLSQLLCGLDWVTANAAALGIRVANMSISGTGANDNACGQVSSDAEHRAICTATQAGVTFVVAAGNAGKSFAATIPAAYPEVLTTTAMTDTDGAPGARGAPPPCRKSEKDDTAGTYSNYAATAADAAHAIAAPGTCVVSDKPGGGTATYFGTSQASPHVAGAVAQCLDGPCAGLAPPDVIAHVRADATTGSFTAPTGRLYGPLVNAAVY